MEQESNIVEILDQDEDDESYAKPPDQCFCSPRNAGAFVWWKIPKKELKNKIASWEIYRYRKDNDKKGKWKNKVN